MTNQEFDNLLNSIREEQPSAQAEEAAVDRVRERVFSASEMCAPFRAEFDAYRAKTLSEGRRMLLEDHLHSCVACRREFSGTVNAPVVSISSKRPIGRIAWWAAAAAVV